MKYTNFYLLASIAGMLFLTTPLQVHSAALSPEMAAQGAEMAPENLTEEQQLFFGMLDEIEKMPADKQEEVAKEMLSQMRTQYSQMNEEEKRALEEETAKFWQDLGVDPSMVPSLEEQFGSLDEAPSQEAQETKEETVPQEASPTVALPEKEQEKSSRTTQEIASLLQRLIPNLNALRQKVAHNAPGSAPLEAWREALNTSIYFLTVMNKPEHHERLTNKEFAELITTLSSLDAALTLHTPHLASHVPYNAEQSPYEVLRILPTAPQKEIDATIEQYRHDRAPATLRAQLATQGLSEKEIAAEIKQAKLTLATLEEAYEKISDPKIRAQTDRHLATLAKESQSVTQTTRRAVTAIAGALSEAVYKQQLLKNLEDFMRAYEPVQLKQRQDMLKAEAQRKKEREAAQKLQPSATPGSLETYYSSAPGAGGGHEGNYYPPYYPQYYGEPEAPSYGQQEQPQDESKKQRPSGPGSGGSRRDTEKKEEEQKKEASEKDKREDRKDKKQKSDKEKKAEAAPLKAEEQAVIKAWDSFQKAIESKLSKQEKDKFEEYIDYSNQQSKLAHDLKQIEAQRKEVERLQKQAKADLADDPTLALAKAQEAAAKEQFAALNEQEKKIAEDQKQINNYLVVRSRDKALQDALAKLVDKTPELEQHLQQVDRTLKNAATVVAKAQAADPKAQQAKHAELFTSAQRLQDTILKKYAPTLNAVRMLPVAAAPLSTDDKVAAELRAKAAPLASKAVEVVGSLNKLRVQPVQQEEAEE